MIPGLNMHGPECHSIVPAVLVRAYQNSVGDKNSTNIREAILSIESAIENIDVFKDIIGAKYICEQFKNNKDCIRNKCPYFASKKD